MANGHGGERVGSGRKPVSPRRVGTVVDFPAGDNLADAAPSVLLEPPVELLAALAAAEKAAGPEPSSDSARVCASLQQQAEIWRRLAPLATDQGTLTAFSVPGFRELCQQLVLKDELWSKIMRFGIEGKSGRDRQKDYARIAQRVDASLARFKLTAFGKPDDGAGAGGAQQAPTNPWAQAK
jgi:hypothetical protein